MIDENEINEDDMRDVRYGNGYDDTQDKLLVDIEKLILDFMRGQHEDYNEAVVDAVNDEIDGILRKARTLNRI
jgi:hypothetical protein